MDEKETKLPEGWAEDKEIVELPEGWRDLDYRIFKTMALLEAKIIHLYERDKTTASLLVSGEKLRKLQARNIDDLYQNREKFNELYYHVFPERLAQDLEVLKQLDALKSKDGPDADPKKA